MSLARGSASKIVWVDEATWNTLPVGNPAAESMPFASESLVEQIDTIKAEDIRSNRMVSGLRGANIAAGGSITADFAIRRYAKWLAHLLACYPTEAVTPSGLSCTLLATGLSVTRGNYYYYGSNGYLALSSGTYTSADVSGDFTTFTSGVKTVKGIKFEYAGGYAASYITPTGDSAPIGRFTFNAATDFAATGIAIEKQILGGNSPLYLALLGGRINSLDLTVPQKGMIRSVWNMLFMQSVAAGATWAGAIADPTDSTVAGYDAAVKLNGVYSSVLREASLNISNGVETETYVLGSRVRQELPEGERAASGKFTMFFKDLTEYNLFKNETVVPIEFSFGHDGEYLSLLFNEAKLTGTGTPQVNGAGLIQASFDFTAFNQTANTDIVLTIAAKWALFGATFV